MKDDEFCHVFGVTIWVHMRGDRERAKCRLRNVTLMSSSMGFHLWLLGGKGFLSLRCGI